MAKNGTVAYVYELPACYRCSKPAQYDAPMRPYGQWAYACKACWIRARVHTTLGVGKGQKLEVKS